MPCEDGLGITKIDLGSVSMKLNLKHDGGKYGVMTVDLLEGAGEVLGGAVFGIFGCILYGDCPW